jgi:uncharacterized membrane protein
LIEKEPKRTLLFLKEKKQKNFKLLALSKKEGVVPMLGNIIVIVIVAAAAALAARSLWKTHKSGGSCGGDCSCCNGCHSQKSKE